MQLVRYNIIIMNRQYSEAFRSQNLNHYELKTQILSLYPNTPHHEKYNYDQFLYIFDQQIHERCDRDVLQELYTQANNHHNQATLEDLVEKYIENLETSKICILRDEYQLKQLQQQEQSLKNRSKTFIFFKMIQASIYTRFTKEPTFQYRILPTDLAPVTLVNALNPILNHQYTLEMEEDSFDLIFYQSGIEILRWSFPDRVDLEEGEYTRTVKSENVTFQAKIKYLPRDQNKAKGQLQSKAKEVEQHLHEEKQALHKLCTFKPFLEPSNYPAHPHDSSNKGGWYNFTEGLFDFFPFMRQHVKTLFYLLIVTILIQCWASFFWSMEFLDIIACFFALSLLLDANIHDYSLRLLMLQLTFLVLSIKSVWGAVEQPFFQNSQVNKTLIVFCIVIKVVLIICLSITLIRKDEIDSLKSELLSSQQERHLPLAKSRLSDKISEN